MSAVISYVRAIIRGEPDAIESASPYVLVCGMIGIGLSVLVGGHGIITAFFAAGLGTAGAGLSEWRSERGLWMLAVVFFLMYGFVYACFCLGQIRDAFKGAQADGPALMVDVATGALLLVANLRFLVTVAKENYSISSSSMR